MGLVLFLFLLKPQFSAHHLVVCYSRHLKGRWLLGLSENTTTAGEGVAIIIDRTLSPAKSFVFLTAVFFAVVREQGEWI